MTFDFITDNDFNFVEKFSERFNVPVFDNKLTIPVSMGDGSIKIIDFGQNFKLLVHRYKFKEDFVLKRIAPIHWNDNVTIIFYSSSFSDNLLSNTNQTKIYSPQKDISAIEISSNDLNSEIRFPAEREIYFTVVGINSSTLLALLGIEKANNFFKSIGSNNSTFLYHENMTQEVEKILKQISDINNQGELSNFYYKIKAQELLYLLFNKLLNRQHDQHTYVNKMDIDKLYAIRTSILADLALPPRLNSLAKMANMSETKMKQLFKQIFGDSIYNYFQKARMEEAAFLLKQAAYSVSEVGYQLGFSNLSHFSRLFQRHYGVNPKQYITVG
jgi:AraC-like DNA-binding protein